MKKKRKPWRGLIAAVTVALSPIIIPEYAHAAPASCPSSNLCVYTVTTYNSAYTWNKIFYSNTDWGYYPLNVLNNDYSWFNNGTQNVCVLHGNYTLAGQYYLTVPLSQGTGYTSGYAWSYPPSLPIRAKGSSNKWIGTQACASVFTSVYL
jgi:hypothetical protein